HRRNTTCRSGILNAESRVFSAWIEHGPQVRVRLVRTIIRSFCYSLAMALELFFPHGALQDAPTWRLPWRARVRRRHRTFPQDVPTWVPGRMLNHDEWLARRFGKTVNRERCRNA